MDNQRKEALEQAMTDMELSLKYWEKVVDFNEAWKDKSPVFVIGKVIGDLAAFSAREIVKSTKGRKSSDKQTLTPPQYWHEGLKLAIQHLNTHPFLTSEQIASLSFTSCTNVLTRAWDLLKLNSQAQFLYNSNCAAEGTHSWCRPFLDLKELWSCIEKLGLERGGEVLKDLCKSGADFANKLKKGEFDMTPYMCLPNTMTPDVDSTKEPAIEKDEENYSSR